jgi:hypothetical protein
VIFVLAADFFCVFVNRCEISNRWPLVNEDSAVMSDQCSSKNGNYSHISNISNQENVIQQCVFAEQRGLLKASITLTSTDNRLVWTRD